MAYEIDSGAFIDGIRFRTLVGARVMFNTQYPEGFQPDPTTAEEHRSASLALYMMEIVYEHSGRRLTPDHTNSEIFDGARQRFVGATTG